MVWVLPISFVVGVMGTDAPGSDWGDFVFGFLFALSILTAGVIVFVLALSFCGAIGRHREHAAAADPDRFS